MIKSRYMIWERHGVMINAYKVSVGNMTGRGQMKYIGVDG
jgi:hypothetical protein